MKRKLEDTIAANEEDAFSCKRKRSESFVVVNNKKRKYSGGETEEERETKRPRSCASEIERVVSKRDLLLYL